MDRPQDTLFAVPPPLPAGLSVPVPMMAGLSSVASDGAPQKPTTDRLAIASAICGLTAFIPIFSQLIGLVLGLLGLLRIRRAKRAGTMVRGRGWAAAGIAGNGLALLGWIALFTAFAAIKSSFSDTNDSFRKLLQTPKVRHIGIRK
ncbi:MAG: hypothetical protein Q7R41_15760 [Phycisphaerales bacterium]|nr:hypothetical protein [Phycisphaerales bacterium]